VSAALEITQNLISSLIVIRVINLPALLYYGSLWPAQWWRKETFVGKPEM